MYDLSITYHLNDIPYKEYHNPEQVAKKKKKELSQFFR